MNGFDARDALGYYLSHVNPREFGPIASEISSLLNAFILYDLHFMRLTGVLDEDGNAGENEYDDDEAFEYIFDAYQSDSEVDDEKAMLVATLLNRYMELQYEYLQDCGLADE